jgi:UDP-perosamine 4-acetyltransferase
MSEPIWVIGAGGHAKVVIDLLRATGWSDIVGILDDSFPEAMPALGVPIRGTISQESIERFRIERAILAIGSNRARSEIGRRLGESLSWPTLVHPTASVAGGVELGSGTVVMAGAIVQADSIVGRHAIINTASSVDHDCRIGDFVHIAPGVHLAGAVRVEQGAFLGIGSCVVPQRTIGAWAILGAGSAAITDVPPGVVAKGLPARWDVAESL